MKANELRQGNIVDKGIIHWIGFFNGIPSVGVLENEYDSFTKTVKLKSIKPIPLTEEWLIKFGFVKSLDYWVISNKGFFVGVTLKEVIYPMFDIDNPMLIKTLKHVHQLQNLYFALTGEELTIKEDETKK